MASHILTAEHLKALGACEFGQATFKQLAPNGIDIRHLGGDTIVKFRADPPRNFHMLSGLQWIVSQAYHLALASFDDHTDVELLLAASAAIEMAVEDDRSLVAALKLVRVDRATLIAVLKAYRKEIAYGVLADRLYSMDQYMQRSTKNHLNETRGERYITYAESASGRYGEYVDDYSPVSWITSANEDAYLPFVYE